MPLQQSTPGGGGRRPRVHWVYVSTDAGPKNQWHAWIAGPCHWFDCHDLGKTKPCCHAVSNGVLACEHCSDICCPVPTGFQPLYRQSDGRPCFVIVHDYSREQIDTLTHHQRVLIGREEGITASVWINPALNKEPRYQSKLTERLRPADITESLLRIWKVAALTEWYYFSQQACDKGLSPPPPPAVKPGVRLRSDKQPFSPMHQAAAARVGIEPADAETNEAFVAAVKRAKEQKEKAERNGQHD